jgi:hypothetical protein
MTLLRPLFALLILAPSGAHAQALYQVANIFALFAGSLLAFSLVLFAGGFILYLSRLGRPYRDEGLAIMQWGVAFLFVYIVCATISRWWLLYPDAFPWFFAIALLVLALFFVAPLLMGGGGKKDADDEH